MTGTQVNIPCDICGLPFFMDGRTFRCKCGQNYLFYGDYATCTILDRLYPDWKVMGRKMRLEFVEHRFSHALMVLEMKLALKDIDSQEFLKQADGLEEVWKGERMMVNSEFRWGRFLNWWEGLFV
jgi:hypothetical protein